MVSNGLTKTLTSIKKKVLIVWLDKTHEVEQNNEINI